MLRADSGRFDFGLAHAVAIGHERGGVLVATVRLPRRPLRALASVAGFGFGLISYVYLTLPDVRPLATTNPASTAFMRLREQEAAADGLKPRLVYRWVPYSRISPNLKRAVLVAEDSAFWDHEGIDVHEIRKSISDSFARRQVPRGASTITQQLAKNLYLSPSYDPLRKVKELIITRRLEVALTKTRIFELYLNVIEWGDRVWGAEAAARTYFDIPAAGLSRQQSALLAGAIVNPRLLTPARPTRRLLRRQQIILARMGSGVDRSAPPPVAATPDPRFPLTVDEEEAQEGEEKDAPAEPAPAPPVDEIPPA
jgi:monofunctional biosynthetic peptidoglycan transglycosylase